MQIAHATDAVVVCVEGDPYYLDYLVTNTAGDDRFRIEHALLVPTDAVFERNGVNVVYVVSGRAIEPTPVTVQKRGRDRIALAGGVAAGTRIALQPPDDGGGAQ